jgi:hypothetical protein
MRMFMYKLLIAIVSFGFVGGISHAQNRAAEKDELESRAQTVNSLAEKKGGMKEAVHTVSVETGVPMEKLQKMRDQHPDAGAAGLMIACVIADNAKGSPEAYLSRHINGKGWAAIARDNNVPLDKINVRLDRLEHQLGAGLPATGHDRGANSRY